MTIYQQLEKIVAPRLLNFKTDLTKHDYKIFEVENYTGPFLYGFRPTGTDLLKLRPRLLDYFPNPKQREALSNLETLERIMLEGIIWITYPERNKRFLYYDGKTLKKITSDRAEIIHRAHIHKIIAAYKETLQPTNL